MDNELNKNLPRAQEENSGIQFSISDWVKQQLEQMSPEKRAEKLQSLEEFLEGKKEIIRIEEELHAIAEGQAFKILREHK